jgi:undecaprenyl-diphosphatase
MILYTTMPFVELKKKISKKIWSVAENTVQFLQDTPPAAILSLIILFGIAVIVIALILFGYLSDTILDEQRIFFDDAIMHFVLSLRSPVMTVIMTVITDIGSYGIGVGSTVILFYLFWKGHRKEGILFCIIVLMGFIINVLLKLFVQRNRPTIDPLQTLTDYSFPSTHSMASFIFFATIAYFAYHFTKNKKISVIIAIVCFLLIFLIGISRIYLGVHYPSDVLGGYLAGMIWYAVIIVLDRTFILMKLFREYKRNAYDNMND